MNYYLDIVLKKEKKAVSIEKIIQRIENLYQADYPNQVLSDTDKKNIIEELEKRVDLFQVYKTPNKQYILLSKTSFRVGRFFGNASGNGTVFVTNSYTDRDGKQVVIEEKYVINRDDCYGAIDGDTVLIDKNFKTNHAIVKGILDRNLTSLTGEVIREGNLFFLSPYDKKKRNIQILLKGNNHIEGEIVTVSLEKTGATNYYLGEVTQVFRHKDDPHEEVYLEAFKCGMPEGFSEESIKQLESISTSVTVDDKKDRFDFTDWDIISIDGADTKDKDDCISLKRLSNGHLLLGGHIADTAAYVPTNSALHKDAFRKGTSYYFGGSVEPQYPRKLSNGICSLHDGVERLTKSVLIEYDENYNVVSKKIVKGVIRSRIGMTYEKVNDLFSGNIDPNYQEYVPLLEMLDEFTQALSRKRVQNGALSFESEETKFVHDENGFPIQVGTRHMGISERIIEECMIACNVAVAEIMTENNLPCIYRVHDVPNQEHLAEFLKLLDIIGLPFPYSAAEICMNKKILQMLLDHISQAGDFSSVLTNQLIRCMARAKFSTENIGHYGTGNLMYSTFTSPIRRLADDTNSRILDECYFEKDEQKKRKAIKRWKAVALEYARQATARERLADKVEEEVLSLDTVRFLENQVGETFEGMVVSVYNNGLTVQLDNSLEGKVRMRNLPGHYVYYPEYYTLASIDGFDHYCLGDHLKLTLVGTNRNNKIVDFKVLEKINDNSLVNEEFDSCKGKVYTKR